MVMICHNASFVDSVKYLKTILNSRESGHDT
jgi:hypothetical protein